MALTEADITKLQKQAADLRVPMRARAVRRPRKASATAPNMVPQDFPAPRPMRALPTPLLDSIVLPAAEPQESQEMVKLDPAKSGDKVTALRETLKAKVIGQEAAVEELTRAFVRFKAGLATPGKPAGFFLMVGPTGSGKTHLVKQFAEAVSGKPDGLIRIDCAEFGERHEGAKLTGAPPGYLGHRETPAAITNDRLRLQWTEDCQLAFVLFDEIDKAHPRVLDLLLGIADNGKLKLGDNTIVDFERTIILMTANSGAQEMQEALAPRWGLAPAGTSASKAGALAEASAKKTLRPELFNRLDKILVFQQLTRDELEKILALELSALEMRMLRQVMVGMTLSAAAKDFLLAEGFDIRYGARHLNRSIRKHLELPLANLLASEQLKAGQVVRVDKAPGEGLEFHA